MVSEKPWTGQAVIRMLLGWFATLCFGVLIGISLDHLLTGLPEQDRKLMRMVIMTLSVQAAALIWITLFLRDQQISWSTAFGLASPRRRRAVLLGVFSGILVLPVVWILQSLSYHLLMMLRGKAEVQPAIEILRQPEMPISHRAYLLVAVVIIAPIAEELLFRGILYPTIKQCGYPRLALWGTALFFAMVHANLLTLLPLVFFAVILTLLYEATENIVTPMIAHATFNGTNFFLALYHQDLLRFITR